MFLGGLTHVLSLDTGPREAGYKLQGGFQGNLSAFTEDSIVPTHKIRLLHINIHPHVWLHPSASARMPTYHPPNAF